MKKLLLIAILSVFLLSCKKETAAPATTQADFKGNWKANLTTDVIFDNASNTELTRVSYLHGLETELTFDGAGSITSIDHEHNTTLTHDYTVRTDKTGTFLITQVVGLELAEYEILSLTKTDLQMKGIVVNDSFYSINGKNYRVHYQRTQFFTKQ